MEVGMVTQGLTPAVQDRDEADPGAEMPGIGGDDAQGLGGRLEQDAVDDCLVLEGAAGLPLVWHQPWGGLPIKGWS